MGARRQSLESGTTSLAEADVIRKDGQRATLLTTSIPLTGPGGEQRRVTFALDIIERKATERVLEHQAYHDALTGLVNRVALQDQLNLALRRASRASEVVAVLFVDLDGFKAVNDEFGHEEGDALLVRVARHLVRAIRVSDTVARLAGDEFVLVRTAGTSDLVRYREGGVTVVATLANALQAVLAIVAVFPACERRVGEIVAMPNRSARALTWASAPFFHTVKPREHADAPLRWLAAPRRGKVPCPSRRIHWDDP
jgi:diguanylate cyclase (GGDEF)-like protein